MIFVFLLSIIKVDDAWHDVILEDEAFEFLGFGYFNIWIFIGNDITFSISNYEFATNESIRKNLKEE